jgi:hypothetical protein
VGDAISCVSLLTLLGMGIRTGTGTGTGTATTGTKVGCIEIGATSGGTVAVIVALPVPVSVHVLMIGVNVEGNSRGCATNEEDGIMLDRLDDEEGASMLGDMDDDVDVGDDCC